MKALKPVFLYNDPAKRFYIIIDGCVNVQTPSITPLSPSQIKELEEKDDNDDLDIDGQIQLKYPNTKTQSIILSGECFGSIAITQECNRYIKKY